MDTATAVMGFVIGLFALLGLLFVIGLTWNGIEWVLGRAAGRARGRARAADDVDWGDSDAETDAVAVAQANAEALDVEGAWFMMTPEALVLEPLFDQAVAALADDRTPVSDVIDLSRHPDGWAASMALAALERRDDVPDDWVDAAIRSLPRPSNCEDALQLRAIARHASAPVIGRVLGRHEGISPAYVAAFVRSRIEGGEPLSVETFEETSRRARRTTSVPISTASARKWAPRCGLPSKRGARSSSLARSGASGSARSTGRLRSSRAGGPSSSI